MAVAIIRTAMYITNGRSLYWIVRGPVDGVLLLENCRAKPSDPLVQMREAELRRKHWREVEPEKA